ncbi:hypothetical protein [Streptomyces sp. SP18CS02]|uniref:hypothetical protein n=1 Tax=Streptomyces sp. SP18CS02 TaxID=3002531 RepID=UPI002E7622DE|nr:hypothetical protein [Streptomyces sp. SP18CS02]MEE1751584.1 hypothetical protein [Streptomyces sp. SP18CS02]
MAMRPGIRLLTVCAAIAGAGVASAAPAAAEEPSTLGAPIVTELNSTGPLGNSSKPNSKQSSSKHRGQASPLPVGGGLLGGLPAKGLPLGG